MIECKQASRRLWVVIISDGELYKNALSRQSYTKLWGRGRTDSVGILLLGSQRKDCAHWKSSTPHCPLPTITAQNLPFLTPSPGIYTLWGRYLLSLP